MVICCFQNHRKPPRLYGWDEELYTHMLFRLAHHMECRLYGSLKLYIGINMFFYVIFHANRHVSCWKNRQYNNLSSIHHTDEWACWKSFERLRIHHSRFPTYVVSVGNEWFCNLEKNRRNKDVEVIGNWKVKLMCGPIYWIFSVCCSRVDLTDKTWTI